MKNENRLAYQSNQIEKLKDENKELQAELTASRQEIKYKDAIIRQAEKEISELKARFERYLYEYSERVEQLTEAQLEYARATAEVRDLMKKYQKEAEANLKRMQEEV